MAAKVSYFAKKPTICPVCDAEFKREDLLSGGGRMNAGELTKELHRVYLPTTKYGDIYPLIYLVTVCPKCYYAAYPKDFNDLSFDQREKLKQLIPDRKTAFKNIAPDLNFDQNRTLLEGIASYTFAMMCYDYVDKDKAPTYRQGVSALRAAWLANDMHNKAPNDNWDYMSNVYYRKAAFCYAEVITLEQDGKESVQGLGALGPDMDQNFGFDGVIYLAAMLAFKYGQRGDTELRAKNLKQARSTVARIVGMGKSSKQKPSAFLELARDLHKDIKKELEEIGIDV